MPPHLPSHSFHGDKEMLSDIHCQHTHTQIGKRGETGEEKREIFSHIRLSLFSLFHLQTSGHPDMSCDPFHFLSLLEGDPQTLTHLFTHTPEIPPPPHWECFLPASMCVRGLCPPGEQEGPTSCVKLPLTFHTLPQSASLWLFSPLSCSFSLSSSLYGGLCQLSDAQNTDSSPVKHDPRERNTFSATHTHTTLSHTQFSRSEGWREQVFGSGDSLFLSPHTQTDGL